MAKWRQKYKKSDYTDNDTGVGDDADDSVSKINAMLYIDHSRGWS